ncbi:MAG TPA: tetratricopeptide repeat protein [Desulfocapsa sulfexigens]|nr:tetratricopeptide repeat protein [Desulfocapsa sulfexigens]
MIHSPSHIKKKEALTTSEKSNLVKKETLIYALLVGLVTGFIGGVVLAVYKLPPSTSQVQTAQTEAPDNSEQLQKQAAAAIANFEAEVTANPNNVDAWTQLGHLYFDSDQPEKAIKAYTKSLELQPDNANVLTDLGVMYRRTKQFEKAIESFEKSFSIEPNHAPSRLNKGIVLLYDYNKPEDAIAAWEELLAIDPEAKMNNGMPLTEAIEKIKKELKPPTPPQK